MMNELEYLKKAPDEEVLNTWAALGSFKVTPETRAYIKDTIVMIDIPGKNYQRLVYITQNYYHTVDWNAIKAEESMVMVDGVMLPWFYVLKTKWTSTFEEDKRFVPYQNLSKNSGPVIIPDDELSIIMTIIGFPAVGWADTEVSPEQAKKFLIKPALDWFYTIRPKIVDEACGHVRPNEEFLIPAPEGAINAYPFISSGPMNKNIQNFQMGMAPTMGRTTLMTTPGLQIRGVTTGRMGKGYDSMDTVSSRFDPEMVAQGDINHYRREYLDYVVIDGKGYVKGFTTTGGELNIKWCIATYNWNDISTSDVVHFARPMCQIYVGQNLSIVRGLVKTDIPGALDPTVIANAVKDLKTDLDKKLESPALTSRFAISR